MLKMAMTMAMTMAMLMMTITMTIMTTALTPTIADARSMVRNNTADLPSGPAHRGTTPTMMTMAIA